MPSTQPSFTFACAHLGCSSVSFPPALCAKCAKKIFCTGHHLLNIPEMGKAPSWSSPESCEKKVVKF